MDASSSWQPSRSRTSGLVGTWRVAPSRYPASSPSTNPRCCNAVVKLAVGVALDGAAGIRLSRQFGLTVSRHALLWVIRPIPCPAIIPPHVLSVDDFARRKRHTYATLLLDLGRRQPLAFLSDREAVRLARVTAQRTVVPMPVHAPACLATVPELDPVLLAPPQPPSAAAGLARQRCT
jgi:hypothetical protein